VEAFDPYAVLGLAQSASALEIKQAYRKVITSLTLTQP
jgi:curved DNA-binding protein CbpA